MSQAKFGLLAKNHAFTGSMFMHAFTFSASTCCVYCTAGSGLGPGDPGEKEATGGAETGQKPHEDMQDGYLSCLRSQGWLRK